MTDTARGREVAHRPDQMVEHYIGEFAAVLPSHVKPETFTRLAVGALRKNPQLMKCAGQNPASLMHALLEAARLGLEPGTEEFYLTPRFGKDAAVVGIVGYRGEVELIYRAGAVTSVKAELVYSGDEFSYSPDMDRPRHTVDWFGVRGEVLGAYAYAEMAGGGVSKVVIIGPEDIDRARAASAAGDRGPWKTDFGAMVLKTAVHRLAKWVPTSAEYRREQLRAATQVAAEAPAASVAVQVTATEVPGVVVDADGVMWDEAVAEVVE